MASVLVCPHLLRNQPGPFRSLLLDAGFEMIDPSGGDALETEQLARWLPQADAVLAGLERFTPELFAIASKLRVIARVGVGYDLIDLAAARERGVVVTITPGVNQESVAEQTFALLLALTRRVVAGDRSMRSGGWDRRVVAPLRGQTLGLVGFGRIGRAVAQRALAFNMTVVAHDIALVGESDPLPQVGRVDLDELLEVADVVSLHVPLTEATRNMVDARFLARMRPGSRLINTARGGLVVEADLRAALESGHLAGAGLDVLNQEPPESGSVLLGAPNLVLSPHVGGLDSKSLEDMAESAARCLVELRAGRWPAAHVVDGGLREGWEW